MSNPSTDTSAAPSILASRLVARGDQPASRRLTQPGDAGLHARLMDRADAGRGGLADRLQAKYGVDSDAFDRLARFDKRGKPRTRWLGGFTPDDWIWLTPPEDEEEQEETTSWKAGEPMRSKRSDVLNTPIRRALRRRTTQMASPSLQRLQRMAQTLPGAVGRRVTRALHDMQELPPAQQAEQVERVEAWMDSHVDAEAFDPSGNTHGDSAGQGARSQAAPTRGGRTGRGSSAGRMPSRSPSPRTAGTRTGRAAALASRRLGESRPLGPASRRMAERQDAAWGRASTVEQDAITRPQITRQHASRAVRHTLDSDDMVGLDAVEQDPSVGDAGLGSTMDALRPSPADRTARAAPGTPAAVRRAALPGNASKAQRTAGRDASAERVHQARRSASSSEERLPTGALVSGDPGADAAGASSWAVDTRSPAGRHHTTPGMAQRTNLAEGPLRRVARWADGRSIAGSSALPQVSETGQQAGGFSDVAQGVAARAARRTALDGTTVSPARSGPTAVQDDSRGTRVEVAHGVRQRRTGLPDDLTFLDGAVQALDAAIDADSASAGRRGTAVGTHDPTTNTPPSAWATPQAARTGSATQARPAALSHAVRRRQLMAASTAPFSSAAAARQDAAVGMGDAPTQRGVLSSAQHSPQRATRPAASAAAQRAQQVQQGVWLQTGARAGARTLDVAVGAEAEAPPLIGPAAVRAPRRPRASRLLPPPLAHLSPDVNAEAAASEPGASFPWSAPPMSPWSTRTMSAGEIPPAPGDRSLKLAGQAADVAWGPGVAGVSTSAQRQRSRASKMAAPVTSTLLDGAHGAERPEGLADGFGRHGTTASASSGAARSAMRRARGIGDDDARATTSAGRTLQGRGRGSVSAALASSSGLDAESGLAPSNLESGTRVSRAVRNVPEQTLPAYDAEAVLGRQPDQATSDDASVDGEGSGWSQGAAVSGPRGVLAALARAEDPHDVLRVLSERSQDVRRLADRVPSLTGRLLRELTAMKTLPDAAASLLSAPVVGTDAAGRPARARQARWSQREQAARVVRGVERPTEASGGGMSADGRRLMQLSQKLTGLVHLVESERREVEATRRVRRATEHVAPTDAAHDVSSGGQDDPDGVTLSSLQREVLDAVLAELDMLRTRREGGPDVDIWW